MNWVLGSWELRERDVLCNVTLWSLHHMKGLLGCSTSGKSLYRSLTDASAFLLRNSKGWETLSFSHLAVTNSALKANVSEQIWKQAPEILTCSSFTGKWTNWEEAIFQALPPLGKVLFYNSFLTVFVIDRSKICGFPQLLWLDWYSSRSAECLLEFYSSASTFS